MENNILENETIIQTFFITLTFTSRPVYIAILGRGALYKWEQGQNIHNQCSIWYGNTTEQKDGKCAIERIVKIDKQCLMQSEFYAEKVTQIAQQLYYLLNNRM